MQLFFKRKNVFIKHSFRLHLNNNSFLFQQRVFSATQTSNSGSKETEDSLDVSADNLTHCHKVISDPQNAAVDVYAWVNGVEVEREARTQIDVLVRKAAPPLGASFTQNRSENKDNEKESDGKDYNSEQLINVDSFSSSREKINYLLKQSPRKQCPQDACKNMIKGHGGVEKEIKASPELKNAQGETTHNRLFASNYLEPQNKESNQNGDPTSTSILASHLAIMPDVHASSSSNMSNNITVGTVIPTVLTAIIPSSIGVDIGCGVIALKTSIRLKDLPHSDFTYDYLTHTKERGCGNSQAWTQKNDPYFSAGKNDKISVAAQRDAKTLMGSHPHNKASVKQNLFQGFNSNSSAAQTCNNSEIRETKTQSIESSFGGNFISDVQKLEQQLTGDPELDLKLSEFRKKYTPSVDQILKSVKNSEKESFDNTLSQQNRQQLQISKKFLHALRLAIEVAVPHGRSHSGRGVSRCGGNEGEDGDSSSSIRWNFDTDVGGWGNNTVPSLVAEIWQSRPKDLLYKEQKWNSNEHHVALGWPSPSLAYLLPTKTTHFINSRPNHNNSGETKGSNSVKGQNVPDIDIFGCGDLSLAERFDRLCTKYPLLAKSNNVSHLGTLGTGNHFIELCVEDNSISIEQERGGCFDESSRKNRSTITKNDASCNQSALEGKKVSPTASEESCYSTRINRQERRRRAAIQRRHEAVFSNSGREGENVSLACSSESPRLRSGSSKSENEGEDDLELGDGHLWIFIHTGSRGVGARIGNMFVDMAKRELVERLYGSSHAAQAATSDSHSDGHTLSVGISKTGAQGIPAPDLEKINSELAYLHAGHEAIARGGDKRVSSAFFDYIEAVQWAQDFSKWNREIIARRVITAMRSTPGIPQDFTVSAKAVNCHHNFIEKYDINRNMAVPLNNLRIPTNEGDSSSCSNASSAGADSCCKNFDYKIDFSDVENAMKIEKEYGNNALKFNESHERDRFKTLYSYTDINKDGTAYNRGARDLKNMDNLSLIRDNGRVWLTRKGATSACKGELAVIPGSMGTFSCIVEGKGNPLSYNTCSHGCGRKYSRSESRRRFTNDDHERALAENNKGAFGSDEGNDWYVECRRRDPFVIDETPLAYKDVRNVIQAQKDLVEVAATVRPLLSVKG